MVIKSLQQAFGALFSFRTWLVVLLPPLGTGLFLSILFFVSWRPLTLFVAGGISQWAWVHWLGDIVGQPEAFSVIFSGAFLVLLFIPILFVSILLVTSLFVTPIVLREVAVRYFPDLERKKGGSNFGSIGNSLRALSLFIVLFILSIPLWFIPGLQLVIPAVLVIWMNKKIFVYDVLQDFASKEERLAIEKREALGLWGLGALLVIFSYIPLAFVILPVFSAFAYSFYALNSLSDLRNVVRNDVRKT